MSSRDQQGLSDHARNPLFNSFRKYSTLLSSRFNSNQTLAPFQQSTSSFQDMISSFEESKRKGQQKRKKKHQNKNI